MRIEAIIKRRIFVVKSNSTHLSKSLGFLIISILLLSCSSKPEVVETVDTTILVETWEPNMYGRIGISNFSKLCAYYENFVGSPNPKQFKILRDAQVSIEEFSYIASGINQSFLIDLNTYILAQLDFWETYPNADYESLSVSMLDNPCDFDAVRAVIQETGWDKDALISLTE